MAKNVGWSTGQMPEKMIAISTFYGELLKNIHQNPKFANQIKNAGARIVSKYFEAYVDHIAKIDGYRYHHIYEFGMTGDKSGRLFKSSIKNGNISYSLMDSVVPGNSGQVFTKKAFIMESGTPLEIVPKNSKVLAFNVDGEDVFTSQVYVAHPGGEYVAGAFEAVFNEFFNSNLPEKALKEFGFYDAITHGIKTQINIVSPKINRGGFKNSAQMAAQMAAQAAYGIVREVESRADRL